MRRLVWETCCKHVADPNPLERVSCAREEFILDDFSGRALDAPNALVKRQKLILPLAIQDYVARLERLDSFEILSVDVQTWLDNLALPWEHRDPADRTIVALAVRYGCPLVTSDQVIVNFYPQTIW